MMAQVMNAAASVTGMATGLDENGLPNAPAGFRWDIGKYVKGHKVLIPVDPQPVDGWDVPPVHAPVAATPNEPGRRQAIEALALAMLQVQVAGIDVNDAMNEAIEMTVAATQRMSSLNPIERAFLAMVVSNGDAQE